MSPRQSFCVTRAREVQAGAVAHLVERAVRVAEVDPWCNGDLVAAVRDYAIFALSKDRRVLTYNTGVLQVLGLTASEFLGRRIESVLGWNDEASARYRDQLERLQLGGSTSGGGWLMRKDETKFFAKWSIYPCAAACAVSAHYIVVVRDATDARVEACARERTDQFLAVLSHELRTPIHALMGWAQLLSGSASTEVQARGLAAIRRNAETLAHIVNDLLDLERIRSGKLELQRAPVDPREICVSALDAVEPMARAGGLELAVRIEPDLPRVRGDARRLQQALWNLLANAVKFTPRGGTISFEARAHAQTVRFVVSDTGCGIAADRLPHIFTPHFQAGQGMRRDHGLGLGLPLVREIVAQHGGRVTASSAGESQGATFTVELPLAGHQALEKIEFND